MKKNHTVIPRNLTVVFNKRKDKVLLIKGHSNKLHWADTYNALGGHVEPGENVYESARREVEEESGVSLTRDELRLAGLVHVKDYHDKYALMFLFYAVTETTKTKPSYEGEVEWVDVNRLNTIGLIAEDLKKLVPMCAALKKGQLIYGTSQFNHDATIKFLEVSVYR